MSELYFAPTKNAPPITLQQLQQRLEATGLPCALDQDSPETCWLIFEPNESTIYASITNGRVTLATFNLGLNDEPGVMTAVERVMDDIGFSADEGDEYV